MRYQVVYSKRGYPITTWAKSLEEAVKKADSMRKCGYTVSVWEHTKTGSKLSKI